MSICSRHKIFNSRCKLCKLTPRDILPDFDRKLAEAETAGKHVCTKCQFEYYLTANCCPICSNLTPEELFKEAHERIERIQNVN